MRITRRKIRFSGVSVLERLWIRKAVKTPQLVADFPGLSEGVLFRTLTALRAGGLVKTRLSPARGTVGRPARFWRPSGRGLEVLRSLLRFRDLWEVIDNRDLLALARGSKVLERLEAEYQKFFPPGSEKDARGPYFSASQFWTKK
jgi:Predicted transcriptional regulator